MDLLNSQTKISLMKAFAGESQARNRYVFAASLCKAKDLTVVQQTFLLTAQQEQEHAKVFHNFLRPLQGQKVTILADYPVDGSTDPETLLRVAHENEYEEYGKIYPEFAQIAKQEGFAGIAAAFSNIATIEKTHGDRFLRVAEYLAKGSLFSDETVQQYMCLNCGHIHTGKEAPSKCPVCQHDRGYFLRLSFTRRFWKNSPSEV